MIKFDNYPTLYTIEEASEIVKLSCHTLRNYAKSGKLEGRKVGQRWYIREDELQKLALGDEISSPVVSSEDGKR